MDNQKIARILDEIYNGWWFRWRLRVIPSKSRAWAMVVQEAGQILDRYEHHPLAVHLIQDLLDELEERSRNEETRGERGK